MGEMKKICHMCECDASKQHDGKWFCNNGLCIYAYDWNKIKERMYANSKYKK